MLLHAKTWCGVILVGYLAVAPPLYAQPKVDVDWPVFRGSSLQAGVADSSLPDTLAIRWSSNLKAVIEGSPIIFQQTVFVGASNGKLYALDLATGKKKWEYQTAGIVAPPAARAGAVYVGDAKGIFHCVDAGTGKVRWTVAAEAEIGAAANFVGDKVIFGSNDHHVYCVTTDGQIDWKCKTKERVRGAPAVAGDRILVAGCDQSLHVINATNGQAVGAIPLGGHAGASVAVHGDHAYVGNMAKRFMAIDWKKSDLVWHFEAKRSPQGFYSSAAVNDDLVIVGSKDKQVRALQRQTGKEVWTFATKGRVDGSPVIVGQRVLIGSLDGNLYLLDLARGTERARFDLGPITSSPAVAGQCAVVATLSGEVYCLGAKKKTAVVPGK